MKKSNWFEHLTPLILAIFPILSLALENIEFIQFNSLIRSLLFSVLVALFLYLLFYLIIRKQKKSAILSGLLIFLLLTYGNIYIILGNKFGEVVRHRYLLLIYVVIFLVVSAFIVFWAKNLKDINLALLYGGLVIVLYLATSIGIHEYKVYQSEPKISVSTNQLIPINENNSELPDIYLILLDGHTRSDVLNNVYGYDNSDFINQLEDLGFWVGDCSQSNYPGTNLSLGSMFEMDYLHNVYDDFETLVFPPLDRTSVFQILGNNNYSTITFHNYVFDHFDITNDISYSRENSLFESINEFEMKVVDTSILRILIDMEGFFPKSWSQPFKDNYYLNHYRDVIYALENLPNMAKMDERLFVYAHLLVTHDPFVFMPDGTFGTSEQTVEGNYINTVKFIDTALPEILKEIIDNSKVPPIILIMGDHGAPIKGIPIEERMSILLALYFQGKEPTGFYEEITPVNAFRLIFNNLWDLNYELINDTSYDIWNSTNLGDINNQVYPPCNP